LKSIQSVSCWRLNIKKFSFITRTWF